MEDRRKIPPSEVLRKEINQIMEGMLDGEQQAQNPFRLLMQKAKRMIVQELLEQEVEEFLGRGYYKRDREGKGQRGYRNGYEPKRIKTAEDKFTIQVPQVRDTKEPFCSRVRQFLRSNSDILEHLATEMYVRGLSVRDIEDAFTYATGDRVLSKSSVSKVTDILWQDYENFIQRDLSKYEVLYLIVDAVYESIRPYIKTSEAILVAYGILSDGRKILLHMELGNKESYDFCKGFLRDMTSRGLNIPLSLTSDGAPGLIKAIGEIFPRSLCLRCWVHKMKNLSTKLPKEIWERIKPEIVAIRESATYQEGEQKLLAVAEKYRNPYPSLVKCLLQDYSALLNVLHLPHRHRKMVRSTNLIERTFVEERRRTKVIPQFLTEKSCLKLVFSVLYRAALRWRKIPMGHFEIQEINRLRKKYEIAISSQLEERETQEALIAS
jgi:putative transposase